MSEWLRDCRKRWTRRHDPLLCPVCYKPARSWSARFMLDTEYVDCTACETLGGEIKLPAAMWRRAGATLAGRLQKPKSKP